ncbi:unnamed protein product [Urochloa humidicola]
MGLISRQMLAHLLFEASPVGPWIILRASPAVSLALPCFVTPLLSSSSDGASRLRRASASAVPGGLVRGYRAFLNTMWRRIVGDDVVGGGGCGRDAGGGRGSGPEDEPRPKRRTAPDSRCMPQWRAGGRGCGSTVAAGVDRAR